ncbi:hypothetical protein ADL35_36740 [Streptomyces sp. NRRL WC-3753]|nr:hypothetical protein ADL35_36740 [Streptomyces sp. NRRL WC-3753]
MRRVAVDRAGYGAAHRQAEGVRREQRVVLVGERPVSGLGTAFPVRGVAAVPAPGGDRKPESAPVP